jgi:hypothetical protein
VKDGSEVDVTEAVSTKMNENGEMDLAVQDIV